MGNIIGVPGITAFTSPAINLSILIEIKGIKVYIARIFKNHINKSIQPNSLGNKIPTPDQENHNKADMSQDHKKLKKIKSQDLGTESILCQKW
ncbi:hypothetical protein H5410_019059 [Solanum commersonii]|uniref:Uncharacterized protein n=1 Tax=Solanum commersonii TaxID=4109 RepID=A0A9J6A4L0_SOLCO|nr:hypothetical protein H5410_019059 [Solanum commersonii]